MFLQRRIVTALLCTPLCLPLTAALATDVSNRISSEDLFSVLRDLEPQQTNTSSRPSTSLPGGDAQLDDEKSSDVVRFGDTLESIAQRHRLSLDQLIQLNPELQNSSLVVGSQLQLRTTTTTRIHSLISLRPTTSGGESWPETPEYPDRQWQPSVGKRWQMPARGLFTSGYGWRWGRMHKGIDIANSIGTPIVAAQEGHVTFAGWSNGGYGYLVEITHDDGSRSLYAHQSRLHVQVGDRVSQGQQIGQMGSTGRSTGPHLHFEIHAPGYGAVNPMTLLEPAA